MDFHRTGLILENPNWTRAEQKKIFEMVEQFPQPKHYWLASSGSAQKTTDSVKVIALSEEAVLNSAEAVNRRFDLRSSDIWLKALPRYHVGGFGIEIRSQLSGSRIIENENSKWDCRKFLDQLSKHQVTLTSLVPTQIFDLVQAGLRAPPCLRFVFVGGAALAAELFERAQSLGWPLVVTYGMTETSSMVAASRLLEDQKNKKPLLIALDHAQISLNSENKIRIQSSSLLTGYVQAIAGRNHWIDPKVNGTLHTEDLGQMDSAGLEILGRSQDWVKILGEGVSLLEIREKMIQLKSDHPEWKAGVEIIARSDARRGADLVLVFEADWTESSKSQFQQSLNSKLRAFEKISKSYQIDRIPVSELGKVQWVKLNEMIDALL